MSEKHRELVRFLEETKENGKKAAIFLSDSPDPDAIGSAAGIGLIAELVGVEADIFYGGEISHPQNKVLVKALQRELNKYEYYKERKDHYGLIIFCDVTSAHGEHLGNLEIDPDVIIDHHREQPNHKVLLADIRPVGAASSIVADYLKKFQLLDKSNDQHLRIATALYWGIKTDTNDWRSPNTSQLDEDSTAYVRQFLDRDMNERIRKFPLPDYIYECEVKAELNKKVQSGRLVTGLEYLTLHQRDALPVIADHHLRREGISTVVVFAIVGSSFHVVLRTEDDKLDEKEFLASIFGYKNSGAKLGSGGAKLSLGVIAPNGGSSDDEKNFFWQYLSSWLTRRVFEFFSDGS